MKSDIIRLHEINEQRLKDPVIAKSDDMIADRLKLLNKISQGFHQLDGIANESDNYEQVKKSPVQQILRQFSTSRFREAGLGQIANNIDSFCTYGNASYILAANKTRDLEPDKVKQRQLTEMLNMLEEKLKKDPNRKVYQDVSGVMVNLSNYRQSSMTDWDSKSFDLKNFLDISFNPTEKDINDDVGQKYYQSNTLEQNNYHQEEVI